MIESLLILFVIFLFIMPLPTLITALGLGLGHLFYKQFLLIRHQPVLAKKLAWYTLLCNGINFFLSLSLALGLSFTVYVFLTNLSWLFIFNFLFCFAVSIRWFDFSNRLFCSLTHRLSEKHTAASKTTNEYIFVVVYGLRKSIGWGAGWTPVFVDAGDIDLSQNSLRFKGLFLDLVLDAGSLENAQPISSEQILLVPRPTGQFQNITRYKLVVRNQFYPFRCREIRDQLLNRMHPSKAEETEVTTASISINQPTSS